jgi:hypothetical protein
VRRDVREKVVRWSCDAKISDRKTIVKRLYNDCTAIEYTAIAKGLLSDGNVILNFAPAQRLEIKCKASVKLLESHLKQL